MVLFSRLPYYFFIGLPLLFIRESASAYADEPAFAPGEVLVRFQPGVSNAAIQKSLPEGVQVLAVSEYSEFIRIQVEPGREQETISALLTRDDVEIAEPNYIAHLLDTTLPGDPFYTNQWGLSRTAAPAAWNISNGSNVIIAVVDTGLDLDHPDFTCPGKLLSGWNFVGFLTVSK